MTEEKTTPKEENKTEKEAGEGKKYEGGDIPKATPSKQNKD